jgi:hypothetical protein
MTPRGSRSARDTCVGVLAVGVFAAAGGGVASAHDEAQATTPTRRGSAFVDPLGFLLFGPRAGVEIGSARVTGALYGRWLDGGLAAHRLFLSAGDEFDASWGAGLRGRYYVAGAQEGFHAGVGAELLRSRVETPQELIAAFSWYAVGYGEVGYRWALGSFYVDAGGAVGYVTRLAGHVENLPGGTSAQLYETANKSSVYGQASVELGVYF